MKYLHYSFLVLTILIFFNNSKAMESLDAKISNQPIQIEGTLNLSHHNNIKYISFEDMNPIIKGLYERYFIPECIPVIPIEIDLKNSTYKKKYKKQFREGIPLSLLAPLLIPSENNPAVEFMIDNLKFKLTPKNKSLVINILTGFEADFVKKTDIDLGLANQENLIAKKIISFDSTLHKKYSHGENGYPAFKENSFFYLCATIRKIIDNQSQITTASSTIAQPCAQCSHKDKQVSDLTNAISSLLTTSTEIENLKKQVTSFEEQINLRKKLTPCDLCAQKDIITESLQQGITTLDIQVKNQIAENFKNNNSQKQRIEELEQEITNLQKKHTEEKNDILKLNITTITDSQVSNNNKLATIFNSLTKKSGALSILTALIGLGAATYAWYKPSKSLIAPLLSAGSFGASITSFSAALYFRAIYKNHKK